MHWTLRTKEVVTKEDMVDFINEYRDVQYKGVMEMDEIATATFGNKLRIILWLMTKRDPAVHAIQF